MQSRPTIDDGQWKTLTDVLLRQAILDAHADLGEGAKDLSIEAIEQRLGGIEKLQSVVRTTAEDVLASCADADDVFSYCRDRLQGPQNPFFSPVRQYLQPDAA